MGQTIESGLCPRVRQPRSDLCTRARQPMNESCMGIRQFMIEDLCVEVGLLLLEDFHFRVRHLQLEVLDYLV